MNRGNKQQRKKEKKNHSYGMHTVCTYYVHILSFLIIDPFYRTWNKCHPKSKLKEIKITHLYNFCINVALTADNPSGVIGLMCPLSFDIVRNI